MDIKKLFFLAITCLVIEVLASLYLVLVSQKSDAAGEAMGQGLGFIGLLVGAVLLTSLIFCYKANIQWAVTTITILACLPILILIFVQTKSFADKQFNTLETNKFEQGEGIFPKGASTALAKAIAANDTSAMKALISQGVSLNQKGKQAESYLHYAIQLACNHGHPLTPLATLLQAGADPNFGAPLLEAFYANGEKSINAMEYLLQKGADANVRDMYQVPILHSCTEMEKLKLLVAHGANLNIESEYWTSKGYTPVMSLVDKESWEAILFLVEQGADRNHQAADGNTLKSLLQHRRKAYEGSTSPVSPVFLKIEEKLGIQSNVTP